MSYTRTDRSVLGEWWLTVDRALMAACLTLVGIGVVLAFATSTVVAVRKGLDPFDPAVRHLAFATLGTTVLVGTSLLTPRGIRRIALIGLITCLAAMVWTLLAGPEINGARRWLRIAGNSLQPSEIAKPCFVLLTAWLLAESQMRRDVPALSSAIGLLALFVTLLVLQPDFGQTVLVLAVWGTLYFLSGRSMLGASLFAVTAFGGLSLAALHLEHVASRLQKFLDPGAGGNYQLEKAIRSFAEGGLLGRGPGEGTVKAALPDAHTDFIFAVIGEEYGLLACLALLSLFAFVAIRPLVRLRREPDGFLRLAIAGLALLLGLQAFINMGVNVGLLPTKGMTLPFVSAGGSSMIAVSLTGGCLLGLMRARDRAAMRTVGPR